MDGYVLQRKAPGANPANALQFKEIDQLCCGDSAPVVACKYVVTFDTDSVTAVDSIRIAGTTHTLSANHDPRYSSGRDALLQDIKDLVESLGYSTKDAFYLTWDDDTNVVTIEVHFSELVFNWLESSANEFLPTECQVVGNALATGCCDAKTAIEIDGTDVIFTPTACAAITSYTINDGGGNVYSGDLSDGSAGDATVADGVVTIDGAVGTGQNWNGEITFTITTVMACGTVVETITLGLVPS